MATEFKDARNDLLDLINGLQELASRRGGAGASAQIARVGERLAENRFQLSVLGEFKRGKSTLINALIGAELLPTGVVPLAAIATYIVHGPGGKARVFFNDGRETSILVSELAQYVTEKMNPRNEKGCCPRRGVE